MDSREGLPTRLRPCRSKKLILCNSMRHGWSPACRLVVCLAATCLAAGGIETPTTVLDHPSANRVLKFEFGLAHQESRRWTGRVDVSIGRVLGVWGWNFSRPDRTVGVNGWDLEARLFRPEGARYQLGSELPGGVKVLPNGVFVSLEAPSSDSVSVETSHGRFSFELAGLKLAGSLLFLDGDVRVSEAPAVRALTRGEASQHDFPAAVRTEEGLFVAWTTFHDEANVVYLAWRREDGWVTRRVTPAWGDYSGTAVSADRHGRIHVLWSEYSRGRWRLMDRAFVPGEDRWLPPVYVSPAGSRQYAAVAVTAADGTLWVAWQEFGQQDLDVFAARFRESDWSAPVRVSESGANDWAPDIAAAPDGSVVVAWDSYATGEYGIYLRRLRADGAGSIVAVPSGPNRAIEPSVAVDDQNAVWVAWADGGPNWGKDWGVLGRQGTQVRALSRIRLARFAGGRWMRPPQELEQSVPAWMADTHEYPTLVLGEHGVPYLFFRKMMLRLPVPEHELQVQFGASQRRLQPWYDTIRGMSEIRMTAFDGARWLPVRDLPLSTGGAYAQLTVANHPDGAEAVWPTDGRTYENPHVRSSQLRYAELDLSAPFNSDEQLVPVRIEDTDILDAAPTEAADLARVRAARWKHTEPLRLYRGDLHRHTDLSADSQMDGDILLAYRYALDAASLDFLAVTDHSGAERLHYYEYQWWRTRQVATMYNQPGRFATFFGYERTVTFPGGHRNVISARRGLQPVSISDEEFTGAESWAERLYPDLRKHGDIAIAHTTAGGGGTDWRDNDPRAEPVVEVFQALRGSYEEVNSPAVARFTEHVGFVWNAWNKGWRIGLLSNSDHESTHQSYACVWAPELTRHAILDAIKARRTYAATDNIVVQFESGAPGAAALKMGSETAAEGSPHFRLNVLGTAPITTLEIIRSGTVLYASEPGTATVQVDFRDEDPPEEGSAHYHVRLVQSDRQIAWVSPIWVDYSRPGR